jgi:hypothetical protein
VLQLQAPNEPYLRHPFSQNKDSSVKVVLVYFLYGNLEKGRLNALSARTAENIYV